MLPRGDVVPSNDSLVSGYPPATPCVLTYRL
ncbi:hypothetical protein ROS9278_03232 [Roseomonas sp. CECT 9278]|nr:hypothetical protein ROS9278_03232 [Roseomonas sp. CECT 9278]